MYKTKNINNHPSGFDFSKCTSTEAKANSLNLKKKTFNFSMKNIPIPSENSYMKDLIYRTEDFLIRVRWRALFFLKNEEEKKKQKHTNAEDNFENTKIQKETFGFRTSKNPPAIKELAKFENDIWEMVENVRFSKYRNSFQREMKKRN